MKRRLFAALLIIIALTLVTSSLPLFKQSGANMPLSAETGLLFSAEAAEAVLSVSAVRSVLIDAASGSILFGNRERERTGMASTTKIMTALVVLRKISVETVFTVPKEAVGIEGSSVYLLEGEKLTIEELLYGLLLASGNDCAVALALACSGSMEAFVEDMNSTAAELGIEDTHFTNPHGLSDDAHYTSAYSLALITAEALKNDTFRKIVSTKRISISYNGVPGQRYLSNHNRLLHSYGGMIGVKTGFTKATGRCLVTAAERDGVRLVAVTLNDSNDWNSHRAMLDYGFSEYEAVNLAAEGAIRVQVPVVGSRSTFITAVNSVSVNLTLKKGTSFVCKIKTPHFLYAPVNTGDLSGYAEFFDQNGVLIYRLPLLSAEKAEIRRLTLFEKIFGADQ